MKRALVDGVARDFRLDEAAVAAEMTATRALILLGVALVLGAVDVSIFAKERVKRDGEVVFLELAPVDPGSLVQGDCMALP